MSVRLRMVGMHARALHAHLFSGDDNEAVAFGLCGRHRAGEHDLLLVHEIHPIPYDQCPVRTPQQVTWRTESLEPLLLRAAAHGWALVKFHSHPTGFREFSRTDDASDRDLFPSVYGWIDDAGPHASVVMLPDMYMFGRSISSDNEHAPLDRISLVADDIKIYGRETGQRFAEHAKRHRQLFGDATTHVLRSLSIGVVGCSGTGSLVIEMLARLGVQRLVLVDSKVVEHRNLNRIVGTTVDDADQKRPKTAALADHVRAMGLGTVVTPIHGAVASRDAVLALAGCDIVFGCMDSHDGRRTLQRLAAYYALPYFDCGVGLVADGLGGIDEICAAAHYFRPDGSSAQARGVIRNKRADAEALARANPEAYAELRKDGYIDGVPVDSPAVISVNALAASLVVNEMLARLHPYRDAPNSSCASVRFVYSQMRLDLEHDDGDGARPALIGRGDVEPLLDMPELSSPVA